MSHNEWNTGIILAGGKSSRMGKDKASLTHGGQSLLERQLNLAKPFCEEVYVSSSHTRHELSGTSRIPDQDQNEGPLMGLYSCLLHSQTDWNLVMTCDMPAITGTDIELLLENRPCGKSIICYANEDRLFPFPGWYHRSLLPHLKTLLDTGQRRMISFVEKNDPEKITPNTETLSHLINLNTPEAFSDWQENLVQ
ncbi:molybdenum cofactor guanylyltransferase [bacterium SCSIO 12741]|nr:molybdenum cofactor guanylyltransferase [bacterium SCSIO 12741]